MGIPWLDEHQELMAEFRKATYEFALSDNMEDYDRMIAAQRNLYYHARKALSEPTES